MLNERGGIPGFFCYILTEEKKKMVEILRTSFLVSVF